MASKIKSDLKKCSISDSKKPSEDGACYPLRMTADHKTEMYVKFAKVMLIFQGPDTDKRRDAVKELASKFKYAGRVVSDETYKRETSCYLAEYNVEDVNRYFKSRVKKSCEEGYNLIIINRSMTNMLQMKYYCFLAQKMQYLILPYPPLVAHNRHIRDAGNTQAQNFKDFSQRSVDNPNYFKHLFCGWFLHDIDSAELREESSLYLQDCFDNIPEFNDMFTNICKSCDFRSYYNMVDKRQNLAFCTVKILQNLIDAKTYMSSNEFMNSYGSMSKLYIVGFIISPHMIAARVKLTHNQKKLWEMPDDLDDSCQMTVFPTELQQSTKIVIPGEEVTLIASKSNRTIITGDPIQEPTEVIYPKAKSRSCHILLGKVNDAPLKNINYDVPFAVFRERTVVQKYSDDVRPYELERCVVRRIGKYWFIYLKETLIVNGLFASCCSVETG